MHSFVPWDKNEHLNIGCQGGRSPYLVPYIKKRLVSFMTGLRVVQVLHQLTASRERKRDCVKSAAMSQVGELVKGERTDGREKLR